MLRDRNNPLYINEEIYEIKELTGKELVVNAILYGIGILFMPLGVVLTINAHLGAGGYDALNFALGKINQYNQIPVYEISLSHQA